MTDIKTITFTPKGRPSVNLGVSEDASLKEKKVALLQYLRSSNLSSQNRYKRLSLSPIRYAGGKSLAVGFATELLPDHIEKVVSPFFGGGSIEIAWSKILGLEVVGYDIFDILANYWNFQLSQPEVLARGLRELQPDKVTFEKIRLELNDVWRNGLELDPLELAIKYVFNFNLSYGPGFMGWASDIYLREESFKKMVNYIAEFEAGRLQVSQGDFRTTIPAHKKDFLYLDPPYFLGGDSKMFKGIYPMRNIPVHHKGFDHFGLAELLKSHRGGFILSYNDCPEIRELYRDYQMSSPSWQYSMGQGETRLGANRLAGQAGHVKASHELLIYSEPST